MIANTDYKSILLHLHLFTREGFVKRYKKSFLLIEHILFMVLKLKGEKVKLVSRGDPLPPINIILQKREVIMPETRFTLPNTLSS